jgi:hypothetical protein
MSRKQANKPVFFNAAAFGISFLKKLGWLAVLQL